MPPRKNKKNVPLRPRALIRNGPQHNRPPPGLKGREIGLYYRNLSKQKKKEEKEKLIHLRIPDTVIGGIYKCLEKIEHLARKNNIYLPPAKKLQFVEPAKNLDFIPLNASDSEKQFFAITNIHKKDDDVVFMKNEGPEVIEILNSSSEDITEDAEAKPSDSVKADTSTKADENAIFVSNNYISITPSTSSADNILTSKNKADASGTYKYGYDDIITGTFQEKLDECLSKGIEIAFRNDDIDSLNGLLRDNHQYMLSTNVKYQKMLKFRETLPAYKKAKDLLDVINNNQVVVISGETGCGKSTQVPQLILDDAVMRGRGANVKVLVTEPRRIAASSLASRVAEERGERPGASVGYAVRLEVKQARKRGSIMFCTTGVLLVELEQNQALSEYSHVILDEVHERDCQVDLAMCMLKQVLQKRKDLKLILMSATIDADTLSEYFGAGPVVHIEGLAYPVEDIYLEEILKLTKYQLPPPDTNIRTPKWKKYTNKGRDEVEITEKAIQYRASMDQWLRSVKSTVAPDVYKLLQDHRIEELDLNLVVELLKHICRGPPGAILVFLPGISEISKLTSMMHNSRHFPASTHEMYALHSKLSTIDQNKIFAKPPNNVRKIIIATNIAETSITIDDVVFVVDCGKMKYKGLNVEKNISTLQVEWISKANLRQRRGRAGRCQPGTCYHLVTSHRARALAERLLPELQRSNLLEEVLCVKKLRLGAARRALSVVPAAPAENTIQLAVEHLQQVGALDENETLTPLGWHLARLPVHPAAGKLLLLGALFGCLNRAASVAAVWGFKEPFQLVIGKAQEVDQSKRDFAMGEPSDHIAMAEAIMQWEQCQSDLERRQFALHSFLSHGAVQLLSDMKRQFAGHLQHMGFLRRADICSRWENRNTDNLSLFKAIVAAALYPNIASVRWINENNTNPNKPLKIKAYTPEDGKVSMHPSSVMFTKMNNRRSQTPICRNSGANWLVYWLKQKSSELFLLDVTCVYTLPLLFFGDLNFSKADNPDECLISISSLKVCCMRETAQLLFQMRSLLDQVLTSKISQSTDEQLKRNLEFDEEILNAVIELITAEDAGTQHARDGRDHRYFEAVPSEESIQWN